MEFTSSDRFGKCIKDVKRCRDKCVSKYAHENQLEMAVWVGSEATSYPQSYILKEPCCLYVACESELSYEVEVKVHAVVENKGLINLVVGEQNRTKWKAVMTVPPAPAYRLFRYSKGYDVKHVPLACNRQDDQPQTLNTTFTFPVSGRHKLSSKPLHVIVIAGG